MSAAVVRRILLSGLLVAAGLLTLLPIACDDDDEGKETPTPAATFQPTSTPAATPDIRDADLSRQPDLTALLQRLGGELVTSDILYVDLTGDGGEEAILPISSGGTAGNLAFIVLGYRDGKLAALLTEVPEAGSLRVEVDDHHLVEVLPVYSDGDTPGFPSQIKRIYYDWKSGALIAGREETVDNPYLPPKE